MSEPSTVRVPAMVPVPMSVAEAATTTFPEPVGELPDTDKVPEETVVPPL